MSLRAGAALPSSKSCFDAEVAALAAIADIEEIPAGGAGNKWDNDSKTAKPVKDLRPPNPPSLIPGPLRKAYWQACRSKNFWVPDTSAQRCHFDDISKVTGYAAWAAKCDCDVRSAQVHGGAQFIHAKTKNICVQPAPPLPELTALLKEHKLPTKPPA